MRAGKRDTPGAGTVPHLDAGVVWVPKRGHTAAEYEDAFAWNERAVWPWRAAVADGATESAFSGLWARLLVEAVVGGDMDEPALIEHVAACQGAWREALDERVVSLPWYASAKAEEGAFAALLALEVTQDGTWRACSVGDCCLFHLRSGDVLETWPFTSPEQFHHRPVLVPSRAEHPLPALSFQSGTWHAGDVFLLATDAVAAWILDTEPLLTVALPQEALRARLAEARSQGALRNDDVTLVRIHTGLP